MKREFIGKSVISTWGNKRAYIISDVVFTSNPFNHYFKDSSGTDISVADYFRKNYKMKVTDHEQPLLEIYQGGKAIHLPPEFCTLDGVPDQIRADGRQMRELL